MEPSGLRDKLALERTRLANERTFLAYVRTALSLIAAGAVILQLFPGSASLRLLSIVLIAAGVIALSFGAARFVRVRVELKRRLR